MDAIKNQVNNKLNKDSQPGNGVEASADNNVNQGTYFPQSFGCSAQARS